MRAAGSVATRSRALPCAARAQHRIFLLARSEVSGGLQQRGSVVASEKARARVLPNPIQRYGCGPSLSQLQQRAATSSPPHAGTSGPLSPAPESSYTASNCCQSCIHPSRLQDHLLRYLTWRASAAGTTLCSAAVLRLHLLWRRGVASIDQRCVTVHQSFEGSERRVEAWGEEGL